MNTINHYSFIDVTHFFTCAVTPKACQERLNPKEALVP